MADQVEVEKLRSYLAAQSAKLAAATITERLQEAADEFLARLDGVTDETARRPPAPGDWSVAEVVDHVTLTLEEVTGFIRLLAGGTRPAAPMTVSAQPVNRHLPFATLVERLRRAQDEIRSVLAGLHGEPFADLRVSDGYFGEISWKGYALILRLHYRDHAGQVVNTLELITPH